MTDIFLKLLNMSITADWIVLAVILFRLLFRKAPKWISCLLWGVVGLRLLKAATCEAPGEGVITCTRCDHSESCTYPQLEHEFIIRTLREPDCLLVGYKEKLCALCGYSVSIEIPRTKHNMVASKTSSYDICTLCGWRWYNGSSNDDFWKNSWPQSSTGPIGIWP